MKKLTQKEKVFIYIACIVFNAIIDIITFGIITTPFIYMIYNEFLKY